MAKIYVVYNRNSGSSDQLDELKRACDKNKLEAEFISIKGLDGRLSEAKSKGLKTIVAAGGDGTVSAVAAQVVGTMFNMGVVPVGTLNHFAKDLKIPLDINQAFKVIVAGKTTKVDTARVNGQLFINNSSIGVYPLAVRSRDKLESKIGKWPAALVGSVKAFSKLNLYQISLNVDGTVSQRTIPFAFVGNNSYNANEFGFTNRKTLNKGQLCLYLVRATSKRKVVPLAFKAFGGKVDDEAAFEQHLCKTVVLDSDMKQIDIALDGEVKRLLFPLKYEIVPQSLNVLVA